MLKLPHQTNLLHSWTSTGRFEMRCPRSSALILRQALGRLKMRCPNFPQRFDRPSSEGRLAQLGGGKLTSWSLRAAWARLFVWKTSFILRTALQTEVARQHRGNTNISIKKQFAKIYKIKCPRMIPGTKYKFKNKCNYSVKIHVKPILSSKIAILSLI